MTDPEDGNMITSVGILAVDNTGQCVGVTVSASGGTNITIGSTIHSNSLGYIVDME